MVWLAGLRRRWGRACWAGAAWLDAGPAGGAVWEMMGGW
jgi:hypothetical protein